MKLYDARGIASAASSDKSIMCSSGGTGTKMIWKLYDDTANIYPDWIPRPAFYEKVAPVFDHHHLLTIEDEELRVRIRLGTSYGRTQLDKDLLKLVLENEHWYKVPRGKFKGSTDRGKGKERREFKGGMLIEKPPKGKGERPGKRPLPKDEGLILN